MTDPEARVLCAEAMGWKHLGAVGVELTEAERRTRTSEIDETHKGKLWCLSGGNDWWLDPEGHHVCGRCESIPDPLIDDAQAMALVKRFPVTCIDVLDNLIPHGPLRDDDAEFQGLDLNRAIVECVAEMQQAKGATA